MAFTPVEIIAAIFAIVILIKLVVIIVDKKKWLPVTRAVYSNSISGFVMLVLAAVVLYYLLLEITIIQIFAAVTFTALLMGLGFMSYGKDLLALSEKIINRKFSSMMWLQILIWLALVFWVLYVLFL